MKENNKTPPPQSQQYGQTLPPHRAGLKCPQCSTFIETNMYQIIAARSLLCPSCGLVLNIDPVKSKKAIAALKKVQEAQENLDRKSHFG